MFPKYAESCMVCGEELKYRAKPEPLECYFCGEVKLGCASCGNGHFICKDCRRNNALDALSDIALRSRSMNPKEIAEQMMAHPSVPVIGGEHHAIVAAALLAALRNGEPVFYRGKKIKINDILLERAIDRTWLDRIPSSTCSNYGACGASLAAGAVFSLLTDATCDTTRAKERQIAMEVTNHISSEIAWYRGTCCKLSVRLAIDGACLAIKEYLGIELPHEGGRCQQARIKPLSCLGPSCLYFREETG